MGNGITNCYPDEVDNLISITVLNDVRLTLGIMCKVVARERRARGLPIGDALAPNCSGTSLVEDDIPF